MQTSTSTGNRRPPPSEGGGPTAPKRRGGAVPLLAGLTAGALALLLLHQERESYRAALGQGSRMAVLFVNRDVATEAPLENDWFEVREVPVEFVHPLAAAAADRDLLTAARAAHPLRAGQPLLWSDVADPASFANEMASLVRPNERAVSLRVSEVSGVGRLIRNNDHVDIFGTFDRPDGAVVTVPILQNVTVVAVGQSLHGDSGGDYATLSVSVSPQEAAMLTLAQETGRLTYVLRNNHDWETVPTLQRVSLDDLFEDAKRKMVQDNRDIRIVKGKL